MTSPGFLTHLGIYVVGFFIRLIILHSPSLTKSFGNRVEISTPLTSWKRGISFP